MQQPINLAGDLAAAIAALRLKLLDLSTRNDLLAFRHPKASSLRLVDALPDEIFARLVTEAKPLPLAVVPAPSVGEAEAFLRTAQPDTVFRPGQRPTAAAWAEHLGIDVRFERPVDPKDAAPGARQRDARLQTLLYEDELDARGRRMRSAANTYIEETGSNALFLALGFLEWTEPGKADKPLLAPLLLVPAEIGQETVRGRRRFTLAHTGEDIETNHCLAKKLFDQAGMVLPEVGDADGPEAYFQAVHAVIREQEGWSVRRQVSVGFFDFGKILLWRDLDPAAWPPQQGPQHSPLVAALLGGAVEDNAAFRAEDHAAVDADFGRLPLVLSADATQAAALKAALALKALVIEGPPGTGKSQTITNLIAAALARGETVLFVAEKLAALEVVKQKLAGVGLDDFVLELHSHKTRKAAVIDALGRRLALQPTQPMVSAASGYEAAVARLAEPASLLGRRYDATRAVSDLLRDAGAAARRLKALAPGLDTSRIDPASAFAAPETADLIADLQGRAEDMCDAGRTAAAHPWRGFAGASILAAPRARFLAGVADLAGHLARLRQGFAAVPAAAGLPEPTLATADRLIADGRLLDRMEAIGRQLAQFAARADVAWEQSATDVAALAALIGLPAPTSGSDIRLLNAVSDAIMAAPVDSLGAWPESLLSAEAKAVIADLGERIGRYRTMAAALRPCLQAAALTAGDAAEARAAGRALVGAGPLGFLKPRVWRAKRFYEGSALPDVSATPAQKGQTLMALADTIDFGGEIGGHDRAAALLGGLFCGTTTPIEAIARLSQWLEETRARVPERRADGVYLWRTLAGLDADGIARLQAISNRLEAATNGVLCKMTADLMMLGHPDGLDLTVPRPFATALAAAWRPGQGKLSTVLLDGFLGSFPDVDDWAVLQAAIAEVEQARTDFAPALAATLPLLSDDGAALMAATVPLDAQIDALEAALAAPDALDEWRRYEQRRTEGRGAGLALLVDHFEAGRLGAAGITEAYRAVVDVTLAAAHIAADPALLDFSGAEIARRRVTFAAADDRHLRHNRQSLRALLLARPVPEGRTGARTRDLTELHLLRHQAGLQRAHRPIRELVHRAPLALQALKPCFMMGPISVAQYLPAGGLTFDLLIMDEASQIRPEDALGALCRAKRAVIVGDSQQLPPTNVFQKNFAAEEEEDAFVALGAESVLEQADKAFPRMPLLWHYRSRHESLIAFSNAFFYRGDLIVFPSPEAQSPSLGIDYRRVPGLFEGGRNRIEAEAIAAAAIEHLATRPDQSLGIVAMNRAQADLIDELLTRLADEHGLDLAALEGGAEGLFVKNLENVQGDERDVMFVSMTYGPSVPGGVVAKNFALINRLGGERRLNVLFSRARQRMAIFTSMDDGDLLVEAGSARGTQVMQAFLRYARTCILDDVHVGSGRAPDSAFEVEVAAALAGHGLEVVAQVGVAGFFIDLAVRDPARPGAFLFGIECDGASYHSGRCARDRDRLRQARLEELGWTIERIWSTDWFESPQREIDRILARAAALMAQKGAGG